MRVPLSQRHDRYIAPTKSPMKHAAKHPSVPSNIRGKHLFDARLWKDPTSTSVFYSFIASLRKSIQQDVKRGTHTHRFIKTLRDKRKLVRCYTQNIDGLESREELCTNVERGKGNRARFTKQSLERPRAIARTMPGGDLDGGCEVVQLHGDLEVLRCTLCQQTFPWNEPGWDTRLLAGNAPSCQSCMTTNLDRQDRGKRGTKIGTLRPNIVLYGEEHPLADAVGTITAHDLALAPDLLLILGTSLHVHGLKVLVKEFAKCVHARAGGKGKVIFVNFSRPTESVWKDVFDYWVSMDCDAWVGAMRRHRPDLFQIQDQLRLAVTKPNCDKVPKTAPTSHTAANSVENKENIEGGSFPTRSERGRPLITIPLKERGENMQNGRLHLTKPFNRAANGRQQEDEDERGAPERQLPTPPSTSHRARFDTPSKKRSLRDRYQDLCSSPSKRRRTATTPSIWEDTDTEF